MIKDNKFMKAFHEAERLYGPEVSNWPDQSGIVKRVRYLTQESKPPLAHTTHRNGAKLMLTDYKRPGITISKYSTVEEAAKANHEDVMKVKKWRQHLTRALMDSHIHSRVLVYEGEKCLLSAKPKELL